MDRGWNKLVWLTPTPNLNCGAIKRPLRSLSKTVHELTKLITVLKTFKKLKMKQRGTRNWRERKGIDYQGCSFELGLSPGGRGEGGCLCVAARWRHCSRPWGLHQNTLGNRAWGRAALKGLWWKDLVCLGSKPCTDISNTTHPRLMAF